MTTKIKRVFLDSNIVLRSHIKEAPEFDLVSEVVQRLLSNKTRIFISNQVVREFLVQVTREQPYMKPLSEADIRTAIAFFESNYIIAADRAAVRHELLALRDSHSFGGKQVHDANIVATMLVYRVPTLLTLNVVDFERFVPRIAITTPKAALEALTLES